MERRIRSLFLVICMLFLSVPNEVFAVEEDPYTIVEKAETAEETNILTEDIEELEGTDNSEKETFDNMDNMRTSDVIIEGCEINEDADNTYLPAETEEISGGSKRIDSEEPEQITEEIFIEESGNGVFVNEDSEISETIIEEKNELYLPEIVVQIQRMIDKLPDLETFESLWPDSEALGAVFDDITAARQVYERLSEEERKQVNTVKLDELLMYLGQQPEDIAAAPPESESEEEIELQPGIFMGEKNGSEFKKGKGRNEVTAYASFYLGARLAGKGIAGSFVTEETIFEIVSGMEHAAIDNSKKMLETFYPTTCSPNEQVKIKATYKDKNGETYTGFFIFRVVNLKLGDRKNILTYVALSRLAYSDGQYKIKKGSTIGQLLKDNIELQDRKKFIKQNLQVGATFASLYSACVSDWTYVEYAGMAGMVDGFGATVFSDPEGNYVIAYRGTDADRDDVINTSFFKDAFLGDFLLGIGKDSPQFDHGLKLYDKYAVKNKVVLTGHSLGGAIANYVSVLRGAEAYTFNAPSSMVSAMTAKTEEFARYFKGLNDGLRQDFVNYEDWIGNTGVGDNPASTKYSNLNGGRSGKGGNLDRTHYVEDHHEDNGDNSYHSFRQMLNYDISLNTININISGDKSHKDPPSPIMHTFDLRKATYTLGSKDEDNNLTYKIGEAFVFGGDGNDKIEEIGESTRYREFMNKIKNDIICGGKGDDIIVGGKSDQDYYYIKGDGCDKIYDAVGKDCIYFYDFDKDSIKWESTELDGLKAVRIFICEGDEKKELMILQTAGRGKYSLYVGNAVNKIGEIKRTGEKVRKDKLVIKPVETTREISVSEKASINSAACPVNMEVYDASGNLAICLSGGEPADEIREYGRFVIEKKDNTYVT